MTDQAISFGSKPPRGGDTGALLRAYDWHLTGLGPLESWCPNLRVTVDVMIDSPVPKVLMGPGAPDDLQ